MEIETIFLLGFIILIGGVIILVMPSIKVPGTDYKTSPLNFFITNPPPIFGNLTETTKTISETTKLDLREVFASVIIIHKDLPEVCVALGGDWTWEKNSIGCRNLNVPNFDPASTELLYYTSLCQAVNGYPTFTRYSASCDNY